jgi:hypothetical protein
LSVVLAVEKIIQSTRCETRVKIKTESLPSAWANWFAVPVSGYVELATCGPISIKEVEWIEINPVIEVYQGRLVKNKMLDNTDFVLKSLKKENIRFEINFGLIRVAIRDTA